MRSQPNRDYVSDDVVQTPPELAWRLVEHFQPDGRLLEPCKGQGNFLRALRRFAAKSRARRADSRRRSCHCAAPSRAHPAEINWCEITSGRDFHDWNQRVDWVITNPPWSQIRSFLQRSMSVADHVVFLMTVNHVWTRARIRDIQHAGFGLKEIVLVDMPRNFPQSGFQLGAVHLARGWKGPVTVTNWLSSPIQGKIGRPPIDRGSGAQPPPSSAGRQSRSR